MGRESSYFGTGTQHREDGNSNKREAPQAKESFSHEVKDEVLEVDLTKLYSQVYVDELELKDKIRKLLQKRSQFTLKELSEVYPLEKGLSELVIYLKIAQNMKSAYLEDRKDEIIIEDEHKSRNRVLMDRVVFVQNGSSYVRFHRIR